MVWHQIRYLSTQETNPAGTVVHNTEQIQASQPKYNSLCGKHKSYRMVQEELLLTNFGNIYLGQKYINKLIAKELITKSAKQIGDKRRMLGLTNEDSETS